MASLKRASSAERAAAERLERVESKPACRETSTSRRPRRRRRVESLASASISASNFASSFGCVSPTTSRAGCRPSPSNARRRPRGRAAGLTSWSKSMPCCRELCLIAPSASSRIGNFGRELVERAATGRRAESAVDETNASAPSRRRRSRRDRAEAAAACAAAAAARETSARTRRGAAGTRGDARLSRSHSSRRLSCPSARRELAQVARPRATAQTPSVIGSSMPSRRARSRSTGAVVRPFHGADLGAAARPVAPRAISSPARRLRPWRIQHVTIRSPIPASPENVSGRAPHGLAEPRHLGQPARDRAPPSRCRRARARRRRRRRARSRSSPRRRARRRRGRRSRRRGRRAS